MDSINKLIVYIKNNKEWIFSGAGVTLVAGLLYLIKNIFRVDKKKIKNMENSLEYLIGTENVEVYKPRAEFEDYFSFLSSKANKKVDAVSITFGFVSYVKLEKIVEEKNIVFNFYVLDPDSKFYQDRINDIHASKNDIV